MARPAPDTILLRHEAAGPLGMGAMELMAVTAAPTLLDPIAVKPGDRVKLAVRQQNDQLVLLRIEKLP
jgi:Cu/Ag efflux protein CusF